MGTTTNPYADDRESNSRALPSICGNQRTASAAIRVLGFDDLHAQCGNDIRLKADLDRVRAEGFDGLL